MLQPLLGHEGRVIVLVRQVDPSCKASTAAVLLPRGNLLARPLTTACTGMQQSACLLSNRSCLGTILPLPIFPPCTGRGSSFTDGDRVRTSARTCVRLKEF